VDACRIVMAVKSLATTNSPPNQATGEPKWPSLLISSCVLRSDSGIAQESCVNTQKINLKSRYFVQNDKILFCSMIALEPWFVYSIL